MQEYDPIKIINKRLVEHYGLDSDDGQPQFRVVWADDQLEKRKTEYTETGVQLLHAVVREMKKYMYLHDVYVLERYVLIDEPELPDVKKSYEPIWVFRDVNDNPLQPNWDVCKIVVDILYAALGKKSLKKYVEDVSPEAREQEVKKLQDELFGNETDVSDALAYKSGIVVPGKES
jgi:hypothetical protein